MTDRFDPHDLPPSVQEFLTERHLASLSLAPNAEGVPHVTPIGVTYDPLAGLARVITWATSIKARRISANPHQQVAICQIDGGRWLTLYGAATITSDAEAITEAVERYATRYRPPKERPDRVVIEVVVRRIIGRA